MKKQKTFECNYFYVDDEAAEWILNLSKCFTIKKSSMKSYMINKPYKKVYKTQVIVEFE